MKMDVSGLFPNNKNQQQQKKASLKFKSIHIYKQLEEFHTNQGIHHLQCIYHERFQIGRKKPPCCVQQLWPPSAPSLESPDHPVSLASSFIFMKPSGMQVET